MTAIRPMLTYTPTRRPLALTTALALAALTTLTVPAHAADECGALPTTEGERTIACTTTTFTPDTDKNGVDNIFYEIGDWTNPADGDYSFTIHGDLTIRGRRSNKGQAREGGVGHGPERRPSDYPIMNERNNVVIPANEGDAVHYGTGPGDDGDGLRDADNDGVWDNGEGPQDDHGRRGYATGNPQVLRDPKNPVVGSPPNTRYAGIYIDTHHEFDGDITLRSEADITVDNEPFSTDDAALQRGRREGIGPNANARGISVHHYGTSGDLDLTVGGTITSPGYGVYAWIDSRFGGKNEATAARDDAFLGDITVALTPGLAITTTGWRAHGVTARNYGNGDVTVTARGTPGATTPTITTAGDSAGGIDVELGNSWDPFDATVSGTATVDVQDIHIRTTGDTTRLNEGQSDAYVGAGIKVYHRNIGAIDIDVARSTLTTAGMRGLQATHFSTGDIAIDVMNSTITTGTRRNANNYQPHAILGQHQWSGDVTITATGNTITTTDAAAIGLYGRRIAGRSGDVTITATGNRITTQGANAHAIWGAQQRSSTGAITITSAGDTITTRGAGAHGIHADGKGGILNPDSITATGSTIITQGAGSHGIHAINRTRFFGRLHLTVDGGSITASGTDAHGIVAAFATPSSFNHAEVTIRNGARIQGTDAVRFEGGRGTLTLTDSTIRTPIRFATGAYDDVLTLTDSTLVGGIHFEGGRDTLTLTDSTLIGSIRFADGAYDDVLTLTQTTRSGRYDHSLDFLGGTDTLALDIAAGRSFVFGDDIWGLNTLEKTGPGLARFAGRVTLDGSTVRVNDGPLALARGLNLANGMMTIGPRGRLVLEAGYDSANLFTFGQVVSGTVRFRDGIEGQDDEDETADPALYLQLSPDLTADQIRTVRTKLTEQLAAGLPLIDGSVTRDGAEDFDVGQLVVRSAQPDGTVAELGTLNALGDLTTGRDAEDNPLPFDVTRIAQLVVPASSDSMDPGDGDDSTTPATPSDPPADPAAPEVQPETPSDPPPAPQPETQSPPATPGSSTPTTPSGGGGGGGGGSSPPSDPAATDAGDSTTPAIPGVADTTQVTWLTNQAAPPPASHTLAAALPAVLLDLLPGPAADTPRLRTGPGSWVSLQGASLDRERTDATVPVAYSLDRRGVALGHELATGPAGTLGVTLHHQTGRATVTDGGTIDVAATTLGLRHAWDLAPVTLTVAASATTLASDLAGGLDATGLDATGLTVTVGAAHRRALAADATLTLGGGLTHARVAADGLATAATPQVTDLKGDATTLALTADWSRPRSTGAVFAGARLALPLDGDTRARIGTVALTSAPRPTLGLEAGLELDGATLALGYARASGGDSLGARLGVAF